MQPESSRIFRSDKATVTKSKAIRSKSTVFETTTTNPTKQKRFKQAGLNLLALPLDGLLEILSFLSLPECILLRSTCSKLKAAVDEHFRTGVRTLPVLLSAHYSPESVRLYDRLYLEQFENRDSYESQPEFNENLHLYEKMTFGSGVSKWEMWEDKTIFQNQKAYFRRENYLILFDMAKFDKLVEFMSKYLPAVTKLSVLLDHDDHLENIPTVLNLYRKQLKVLLLERTNRSGGTVSYNSDKSFRPREYESRYEREAQNLELSEKTFRSIDSLEVLEELYLFPKWKQDYPAFDEDPNSVGRLFVEGMLHKLRIMHLHVYDYKPDGTLFSFQSDVYENLEELCFGSPLVFLQENPDYPQISDKEYLPKNVSFPRLKKCFFLYSRNMHFLSPKQMPNLEEIGVYKVSIQLANSSSFSYLTFLYVSLFQLDTEYESMKALNSFPNLVQTHSILEYEYRQIFKKPYGRDEKFVADRDPRYPFHQNESGRLFVNIGERLTHFPGPGIICKGPRNRSRRWQ